MRRYDETVEVRLRAAHASVDGDPDASEAPATFIWRGRLYVVRAVLDHWHQRTAWWRTALDGPGNAAGPAGAPGSAGSAGPSNAAPVLEEEVWRVEASPGRLLGVGVFDLARGCRWRLIRMAD